LIAPENCRLMRSELTTPEAAPAALKLRSSHWPEILPICVVQGRSDFGLVGRARAADGETQPCTCVSANIVCRARDGFAVAAFERHPALPGPGAGELLERACGTRRTAQKTNAKRNREK
jgi:hypothetical protein